MYPSGTFESLSPGLAISPPVGLQWQISIGRRYNREKLSKGFQEAGPGRGKTLDQNDPLFSTANRLADEYKISAPTVKRYAQKAKDFEELAQTKKPPVKVAS